MSLLQPSESGNSSDHSDDPSTLTVDLASVKAVATYLPFIDNARSRVTSDMEQMVITGLRTLVSTDVCQLAVNAHKYVQNQSLLASSLQTAHNLRVLPELVQNLVSDLSDAVEGRIRSAFDLSRISKDIMAKGAFALVFSNSS